MRTRFRFRVSAQRGWKIALACAAVLVCARVPAAAQPVESASLSAKAFTLSAPNGGAAQSESSTQSDLAARSASASVSVAAPSTASGVGTLPLSPETLGDLMMIRQQYLAAINDYQRALFGRAPKDAAVVWNKLGIAYQHMYALNMARLQYEKAIALKPRYANAINNLGTIYYGERSYGKAEKCYRKAIHLKPKVAAFYSNLGTAYFAAGKYKQGIRAYRKAFALDPDVFLADQLNSVSELGPSGDEVALNYALARLYAGAHMFQAALHCLRVAYMDGFTDNDKLMHDAAFAALRATPQFRLFMTEERIDGAKPRSMVAGTRAARTAGN